MSSVAIIGTRDPDANQDSTAHKLATYLSEQLCCTIKTGGAYGIDQAAMEGTAPGKLTVCLPWASYNSAIVPAHAIHLVYDKEIHTVWKDSVFQYHPAPLRLSGGAVALHARNYGIIEGCDLVVAMPNETGGGGTGQGIRVAKGLGIPVIQINKGSGITDWATLLNRVQDILKVRKVA